MVPGPPELQWDHGLRQQEEEEEWAEGSLPVGELFHPCTVLAAHLEPPLVVSEPLQGRDTLGLPLYHTPYFPLPLGTSVCDKGVLIPALLSQPGAGLCFFPQGPTLALGVSSPPAHSSSLCGGSRAGPESGSPNHCEPS